MKDKVFIDTNVIVYLFSTAEIEKRDHCEKFLSRLKQKSVLVWSTQIIQEFYNTMTIKFRKEPMVVKHLLKLFNDYELVINNFPTIENAIDIQIMYGLSFWDSLVVSAAELSKCSILLTEDMHHGQMINGIQILSPFQELT